MSFASLLDYTVRIWRATPTPGVLGTSTQELSPVGIVPATCKRPVAPIGDVGPGLAPIGERTWYCEADVDVRERDVLEPVTGPDLAHRFEVDGPPTRPRSHHTELRTRHWLGKLPGDG
jgi:hypothetical protein